MCSRGQYIGDKSRNPRAGEAYYPAMQLPLLVSGALTLALTWAAFAADPATAPSAPSSQPSDRWDAKWFDYARTDELLIEQTTPKFSQVDWRQRPPRMDANDELRATNQPAKPYTTHGLDI